MTEIYTAHTIAGLAGALPTLYGFMPEHSLCAISTTGPRHRFGFRLRVDLPPEDLVPELASLVIRHLSNQGAEGVVLMTVGDTCESDGALALLAAVEDSAVAADIALVTSMWIDTEARTVADVNDPDNVVLDLPANHPALALAVAAGQSIVGRRSDLEAGYAHAPGELTDAVFERLLEYGPEPDGDEAVNALALMLNAAPADIGLLADCIATLTVAGTNIKTRDAVWGTINRANATEYACALRTAATHAPAELAHPLYALTAFTDWLTGDGTRALIAVEIALSLAPDYAMASLIMQLLEGGVNPAKWAGLPTS